MDIYQYLNKPKLNQQLSDKEFEAILPTLIDTLVQYGFQNIIRDYNDKYLSDIFRIAKELKLKKDPIKMDDWAFNRYLLKE
jgi:hypothetical protein